MGLLTLNRWLLAALVSALSCATISAATGARRLADLNPGSVGSYPSNFTGFGGALYFSAYAFETGRELWKYDGATVTLAANINPTADDIDPTPGVLKEGNDSLPTHLTEFGGQLYFSAFHPARGAELWRFDGAQATRVSDINPDPDDTIREVQNNAWPYGLTVLNDTLYFTATSRTTPENYELWKYNAGGVQLAANLRPDAGTNHSSYPTGLHLFNGALYFMADDGAQGWELWRHNGSASTLFDLNPGGPESSSYPKEFIAFNNELYFSAYSDATGFELWRFDGSTATLAADVQPGPESSYAKDFVAFNGALYFQGFEASTGNELRKFSGGQATLAADINPAGDSYPKNLTLFGNLLIFAANDGINGWELWKYDGVNVSLITNLNAFGDAFPEELTVLDDALYFTATTPETGYEIWKFDGTNVTLAADVNLAGDSFPRNLAAVNGQLYFSAAEDGVSNWEPWVIDASTPANQPPSVSLTAPAQGATFLTTDTITFSADATDDMGIAKVEFYADATLLGTDTTAPYSVTATLAVGTYGITAVAFDISDASGLSGTVTITVQEPAANQPPTVSVTSPAEGASFLTTDNITITAGASDDVGVTRVEFYSGETLLGADTAAPYSITSALASGTHAITAKAFDAADASATSEVVTITVREPATNQPPTVSLTSPAEGATFLTTEIISFSADASDDAGVTRVEFYAGASLLGTDTTSPYSITSTLAAGSHVITAKAFDASSASATTGPITITVQAPPANQPPAISLTSPADGATFLTTDNITFSADASDDVGVTRVEFYAGASLLGTDTTSPYSIISTLAAGTHVIIARAFDAANASATSGPITITVREPNPPPSVSLLAPAQGAAYLTTDAITFNADASDDSGVGRVEFYAGGALLGADSTAPYRLTANLGAGTHDISARAFDLGGATATSAVVTITVSEASGNQPPAITLTSPEAGRTLAAPASVTLRAVASDADGVADVQFFSGSTLLGTDASAPYEVTTSNLAPGIYPFTAVARDLLGATALSTTIEITVADRPTLVIARNGPSVLLTVGGSNGIDYSIETSTDLLNWTHLRTATPVSGTVSILEPATDGHRFYRVAVR